MEYIIKNNFYRDDLDDREVVVSIRCITYNHEPYIREALEGFVMQQTNFRFEAIVHDDASTDGTAAIIREYAEKYPSIIKPIFETENQYSKHDGSLGRIMDAHIRGKYLAYCEGDDYWTDPLKLQKQVDFLESHPDYSMCHTAFELIDEYSNTLTEQYLTEKIAHICSSPDGDKYLTAYYLKSKERFPMYIRYMEESCSGERFWFLIAKHNYIITATCMFRKNVCNQVRIGYFDYGMFLTASRLGRIGYIDYPTSKYRFHPHSAMTDPDFFRSNILRRSSFNTWGELKRVFDKSTCKEVMTRPGAKKMLVRKIFGLWFNAPEYRKEYLCFMLKHPSIWYDMARYCIRREPKLEEVFDNTNR